MKRRVSNFAKQTELNRLAERMKELKDAAARAIERKLVKEQFGDLFIDVTALLYEADPMGINAGCNPDEYGPEVGTILPRLSAAKSVHDVESIIYEEFCNWFSSSESVGQREKYKPIAAKVWEMWNDYKSKNVVETNASTNSDK